MSRLAYWLLISDSDKQWSALTGLASATADASSKKGPSTFTHAKAALLRGDEQWNGLIGLPSAVADGKKPQHNSFLQSKKALLAGDGLGERMAHELGVFMRQPST